MTWNIKGNFERCSLDWIDPQVVTSINKGNNVEVHGDDNDFEDTIQWLFWRKHSLPRTNVLNTTINMPYIEALEIRNVR